jgi:hypothetical protein
MYSCASDSDGPDSFIDLNVGEHWYVAVNTYSLFKIKGFYALTFCDAQWGVVRDESQGMRPISTFLKPGGCFILSLSYT